MILRTISQMLQAKVVLILYNDFENFEFLQYYISDIYCYSLPPV